MDLKTVTSVTGASFSHNANCNHTKSKISSAIQSSSSSSSCCSSSSSSSLKTSPPTSSNIDSQDAAIISYKIDEKSASPTTHISPWNENNTSLIDAPLPITTNRNKHVTCNSSHHQMPHQLHHHQQQYPSLTPHPSHPSQQLPTQQRRKREFGYIDNLQGTYGFIRCIEKLLDNHKIPGVTSSGVNEEEQQQQQPIMTVGGVALMGKPIPVAAGGAGSAAEHRIFFHKSACHLAFEALKIGDYVEFVRGTNKSRPIAENVKILDSDASPLKYWEGTILDVPKYDQSGVELPGSITYTYNEEHFFLKFLSKDLKEEHHDELLQPDDKVIFKIRDDSKSKTLYASQIEKKYSQATKFYGVVTTLKERYGFIERADQVKEIYFNLTEVPSSLLMGGGAPGLHLGTEFEFNIKHSRNNKEEAVNLREVPKGTVQFQDVQPQLLHGCVMIVPEFKKEPYPGYIALDENDRAAPLLPAKLSAKLPFSERDKQFAYSLFPGDPVCFQIAVDRRDGLQKACKVQLNMDAMRRAITAANSTAGGEGGVAEHKLGRRELGVIRMFDQFGGFIIADSSSWPSDSLSSSSSAAGGGSAPFIHFKRKELVFPNHPLNRFQCVSFRRSAETVLETTATSSAVAASGPMVEHAVSALQIMPLQSDWGDTLRHIRIFPSGSLIGQVKETAHPSKHVQPGIIVCRIPPPQSAATSPAAETPDLPLPPLKTISYTVDDVVLPHFPKLHDYVTFGCMIRSSPNQQFTPPIAFDVKLSAANQMLPNDLVDEQQQQRQQKSNSDAISDDNDNDDDNPFSKSLPDSMLKKMLSQQHHHMQQHTQQVTLRTQPGIERGGGVLAAARKQMLRASDDIMHYQQQQQQQQERRSSYYQRSISSTAAAGGGGGARAGERAGDGLHNTFQGWVVILKENFGFIETSNYKQLVKFVPHRLDLELAVNSQVEFVLPVAGSSCSGGLAGGVGPGKARRSADRIRLLPANTLPEPVILEPDREGVVIQSLTIADYAAAGDRDSHYHGIIQDSVSHTPYPYTLKSLVDLHAKLFKGDKVRFDVAQIGEDSRARRACNTRPVKERLRGQLVRVCVGQGAAVLQCTAMSSQIARAMLRPARQLEKQQEHAALEIEFGPEALNAASNVRFQCLQVGDHVRFHVEPESRSESAGEARGGEEGEVVLRVSGLCLDTVYEHHRNVGAAGEAAATAGAGTAGLPRKRFQGVRGTHQHTHGQQSQQIKQAQLNGGGALASNGAGNDATAGTVGGVGDGAQQVQLRRQPRIPQQEGSHGSHGFSKEFRALPAECINAGSAASLK